LDNAFLGELAGAIPNLIVLVLSLTVHEFFHAWAAWRLGDDTAARAGRLTLNPVPHVDVLGTIILPLMNAPIGWAKPVPVNPARFRRDVKMSTGDTLVSLAGPASNLALGLVAAIAFGLLARFAPDAVQTGTPGNALLIRFMLVNAGLAIFNVLPVPPLDGSHVAGHLVPLRYRDAWESFARIAPLLLFGLLFLEQQGIHTISYVLYPVRALVIGVYSHVVQVIA
jgi:Zn-dependent protease